MLTKHLKTARKAWQQDRQTPSALKRSRDEYEFQPGYLEIVERPPAPLDSTDGNGADSVACYYAVLVCYWQA